jgi:putative peptidoglycan lipid II flippase
LLRSSAVVGSMTMLSRVLGLVRDIVLAIVIGAASYADAFFVAFKIPNFLRRLFAEGAFAQAFVPVLSEYRQRGSIEAVQELVNRVAGALGSVLLMLTVLAVVGSPVLATLFAPGFIDDAEKFAATSELIRITFPYLFFISMTGFAGGILNSYDRFAIPAFTPVLLNVSLITAALVAAPWFDQPVFALAWGVFFAGVLQLLFQVPFLMRLRLMPRPEVNWQDEGVRRVLKLMAPAIFGVSVSQINLLLDTVIASFLPDGSVSWLYYSDRLTELPLGVFGVAVATVILPNLSRQHAAQSPRQFRETLDWALRLILIIAIPAAVALITLAEPILITLFYHGDVMTPRDMAMATLSMRAYALGLTAFMLIKVLAPGFYARQDMKTPVRIGVIAMLSNMVLNVLFVVPLHSYWQIGHVGLALATAASACLNAGLLLKGLLERDIYQPESGWWRFVGALVMASVGMLACLLWLMSQINQWLVWQWWERAGWLAVICAAGLAVYLLLLWSGGIRFAHIKGHIKPGADE